MALGAQPFGGVSQPISFGYSTRILSQFPSLCTAVAVVHGVSPDMATSEIASINIDKAIQRLAADNEGAFPEIAAWRRVFSTLGLKPTQYRSAPEALLRRLRTSGDLPVLHPLVNLCNSVSVAYAVPIAVFDVARVSKRLLVRHARGDETYLTFGGDTEIPEVGEVVFVDAANHAHARRWCHRQSAHSAVCTTTSSALIVIEGMHEGAAAAVVAAQQTILSACGELGLTTLQISVQTDTDA